MILFFLLDFAFAEQPEGVAVSQDVDEFSAETVLMIPFEITDRDDRAIALFLADDREIVHRGVDLRVTIDQDITVTAANHENLLIFPAPVHILHVTLFAENTAGLTSHRGKLAGSRRFEQTIEFERVPVVIVVGSIGKGRGGKGHEHDCN